MPHVAIYTSPARGHLFPVVPIAQELRRRNHRVSIRTLASQVPMLTTLGFGADAVDPALEAIPHDDYLARSPLAALKRSTRTFLARAPIDAADLGRMIRETGPDFLLVDINAWGALAVAEAWGGPWAAWCPYPLPLPSRDAPPFGPGLPPARGVLGRMRDALVRPFTVGSLERLLMPSLNDVRHTLGLRAFADAVEMFSSFPLLLYMTAEPFEYPRSDWPPCIRMIGPCDWDPPATAPDWVEAVDRPVVLVTTSSEYQADERLVSCVFEALAGEDLQIVATVPSIDPGRFQTPANARLEVFVPHGPLLDRAACAVTHGGMGATQKALARGVPVCAVPFGRDQLEVARRVEVAGAGTQLPGRRLEPARLRSRILAATGLRDGARRVADAFRAAGGAPAAGDAIEAMLGATPGVTVPGASRSA